MDEVTDHRPEPLAGVLLELVDLPLDALQRGGKTLGEFRLGRDQLALAGVEQFDFLTLALKALALLLKLLELHLGGSELAFHIFTLPGSGRGAGVHFKLGAAVADLEVVGVLGGGWHCLWAGCGTAGIFYYQRVSPARKIIRNY